MGVCLSSWHGAFPGLPKGPVGESQSGYSASDSGICSLVMFSALTLLTLYGKRIWLRKFEDRGRRTKSDEICILWRSATSDCTASGKSDPSIQRNPCNDVVSRNKKDICDLLHDIRSHLQVGRASHQRYQLSAGHRGSGASGDLPAPLVVLRCIP